MGLDEIRDIKKRTTILNAIGLVLMFLSIVLGAWVFIFGRDQVENIIYFIQDHIFLNTESLIDIFLGIFAVGGTIVIILAAVIYFGFIGLLFVLFLLPTISGFVFLKKTESYLDDSIENYLKMVKRDSIAKIVFDSILLILFLFETTFFSNLVSIIILGLLIYAIFSEAKLLKDLKED